MKNILEGSKIVGNYVNGVTWNEGVYFIRSTLLAVSVTECLGMAIVISNWFGSACVYSCTTASADLSMAIDEDFTVYIR